MIKAVKKYSNVVMKRASGSIVYGHDNKKYIDFTSGIGSISLGYNNKRINYAIKQQLKKFQSSQSMCFQNCQNLNLCNTITSMLPDSIDRTYVTISGSDAVDSAIRMARYHTGKKIILSMPGGYHGKSLGLAALTENIVDRSRITPFVGSCFISENILGQIDNSYNNIAAVLIECIKGEGGIYKHDDGFMQALRKKCTERGILLIVDEIQTFGRTGELFAFQHSNITPDIVVIGKAIGGGLPIASVSASVNIFDSCPIGSLGNTYGANSLSVSASQVVLDTIKEEYIVDKIKRDETIVKEWCKSNKGISDSHIYGLMIGLSFDRNVDQLRKMCENRGLLTLPTRQENMIRLLPPLNVSEKILKEGLDILSESIYEFNNVINI